MPSRRGAILNYSQWSTRRTARFLEASIQITPTGARQQLILIFGFDTCWGGRVQVYTDAGLLSDQILAGGDNQFAIEIDSLDQAINLYFVHAGGSWFFRGISGYLV